MKFVDEYRDSTVVKHYAQRIREITTKSWQIMEICGGQTHSILKYGLDQLLPSEISLIHGPGCPVCVTDIEKIDKAGAIASLPNVILCSFGDMLRVPGSKEDLLSIKAKGADIRIVYSPLDCIKIAEENPNKEVIFFAVGFETTAPTTAMTVYQADKKQLNNFSLLVSHVLVPPAMEAILSSPQCQVQGFLAAGHVCTVMGFHQYETISKQYQIPIIVTGFEPADILQGIYLCVQQLEKKQNKVENQYSRCVKKEGNKEAQKIINQVFEITNYQWRGIGKIDNSGFKLREKYTMFDAEIKFNHVSITTSNVDNNCISGQILQGIKKPHQCQAFGNKCTPENPLGAPMVSSEGACAAYYRYHLSSI
ncbi:hydrogenase formation protein HypD [Cyanobacterium sp. Dongsha4]|uniref:hydrogenase formation protein HypD n=1 Tax=Cyanobacterium sp. DS4 TaxID=2878255 RepID=UPI002E812CEE|nr:hydrogenase formation protein HypD [Cyanobacterium sp. Dongsha4]WVL01454.1 hydrogenase formation protein HypD [Cyanobacterium sp. Dongsha4]